MYLVTTCSKPEPTSVWKMGSSVIQVVTKYIVLNTENILLSYYI